MPKVMIVTGEASGDQHGANLATALRAADPTCELSGVGGPRMSAAGVRLLEGLRRLDHMGLAGLSILRDGYYNLRLIARYLRSHRFDAVVLIDNAGMNLQLAKAAKAAGHRVVYYIAPQIWASRPRRIRLMKRVIDLVLVIFPFEPALYEQAGVACRFVGHPLLDEVAATYDRDALRRQFGLTGGGRVVGLLPGSRVREIEFLLPPMLAAARRIRSAIPECRFVLAQASSISHSLLDRYLSSAAIPVTVVAGQPSEVMAASDVLLVASGTATLQAAIVGTPMVLTYRTTWLTYQLAKRMILVRWIGLVNILAGREVIPELIQGDATGERLSQEALRLLRDRGAYEKMKQDLADVRQSLGEPGASERAAEAVLKVCAA
ncbi:lipid-A-disaccharide synthase [Nitrospira sp.]|nr:lipid-A-disaccharide synthase [Nitrospira sp.]